ncbi:sugar transferase [Hufsiella ginkgonis]|uniref:Exopolysaccharide biosynthesis polyprenyl glycosylphosphotransferase n=1 Tax=Hufsiella ginkgonis TaxID=2695274 RepID=A0A7K1Y0C8_9SPHI|nr:sugar transferase [Hufsiella ginkgonis]MXV16685.1 exopolysaccharide biosynthesis polyprenyl glycosylphosphotransferase [Hufsiella ginkgonis]
MEPFIYISDLVIFNIALFISYPAASATALSDKTFQVFILVANLSWICASKLSLNYVLERPLVFSKTLQKLSAAIAYHLVLTLGAFYFLKMFSLSGGIIALYNLLFFVLAVTMRAIMVYALEFIRRKGYNIRRVSLIGDSEITSRLVKSFDEHSEYGYQVIHRVSEADLRGYSVTSLVNALRAEEVNELFICYKQIDNTFVKTLINECYLYHIKVKLVSDLLIDKNGASLMNYNGIPVLVLKSREEEEQQLRIVKRGFDIVFSAVMMICGLPLFIVLGIITKLTSRGPIFYKQQRIGFDEVPFVIYKFRSMYVDSERMGPQLATANDRRITPWGLFMRKTRLDELPQFWNVLKGDMSVVGPRPERKFFIDQIITKAPDYRKIMRLKPGVTSVGQVYYGYAENVDQMCDRMVHDLEYKQNFRNDMHIIFKTVGVMFQAKGK